MTRKELLPATGGAKVKFTEKRKEVFLRIFTKCNSVTQAAKAVRISTNCVYDHLRNDTTFAKLYEKAQDLVLDNLEAEAYRRGVTGVKKPVYYQGRLVGYELTYSDKLLEMLLRGRSDKYSNKTSLEVKGQIDHKVDIKDIKEKLLEKALSRGIILENDEVEDVDFEEVPEDDSQGGDTDEQV